MAYRSLRSVRGSGHHPRLSIGSVKLAEFFLTFISAGVSAMLVNDNPWVTVAGLVVGGRFAAPFAAMLTRRLHTKALVRSEAFSFRSAVTSGCQYTSCSSHWFTAIRPLGVATEMLVPTMRFMVNLWPRYRQGC